MAENRPKADGTKRPFNFSFGSAMLKPRNKDKTPDSSDDEGPRPAPFQAMGTKQVKVESSSGVFSTNSVAATTFFGAPLSGNQIPPAPLSTFHKLAPQSSQVLASTAPGAHFAATPIPSAPAPSWLFRSAPTTAAPAPVTAFQNTSQGSQVLASAASTAQFHRTSVPASIFPSAPAPVGQAAGAPTSIFHKTASQAPQALAHLATAAQTSNAPTPTTTVPPTMAQTEDARLFAAHMALLDSGSSSQDRHEISGTPLFTKKVLDQSGNLFSQYGFLAGMSNILDSNAAGNVDSSRPSRPVDPRLFFNISAPSSAFICGSQGSGKSHTLSCLLENCLMKSDVSKLDNPLAALVFHYDSFTSDIKGTPCETAHLSSNPNIKVRILCSPTNFNTIKRTYAGLNVTIEPLRINQTDLNTKRMLDLMAVNQEEGRLALYLHSINRILRDLRLIQQENHTAFNYRQFKKEVDACDMTPAQLLPLNMRLDTLESFMPKSQTSAKPIAQPKKVAGNEFFGNDWSVKPGSLTIVDLSCPCVTSEGACALFNMCLSLFLEQKTTVGRAIGLDEAHKYMNAGAEASTLTNTLLSSIRLQRHLGTRVFISTQEPTISPKLLDLCSITIVHRFTSPDWLRCLRLHLAALSDHDDDPSQSAKVLMTNIFNQIVKLRVGEALLFAPSAIIGVEKKQNEDGVEETEMKRLGMGYLKIKIRARVTSDGGRSVFAMGAGPTSSGAKTSGNVFGVPAAKPAFGVPTAGSGLSKGIKPATSLFGFPSTNNGAFGGNKPANPTGFGTAPITTTSTNTSVFGTIKANSSVASASSASIQQAATTFGAPSPPTNHTGIFSPMNTLAASNSLASSITLGGQKFDPFKSSSRTTITGTFNTSSFSMFSLGTKSVPFQPFIEKEPNLSSNQQNSFQNIGFQLLYQKFSQEELRLADYTNGLRDGSS